MMETVEVLKRIRKEISEIELTSWDYDNKLYEVDGQTVQLKAIRIIDKYLSEKEQNMETVEVVIKIPKEDLKSLQELVRHGYATSRDIIILKGTPLPKGHDDLIERAQVTNYDNLYDVPTVIEADKEVQDENN